MFQTSYFSSKAPRGRKVCIAKWAPRGWMGPRASKLAPSNPKALNWQNSYMADLEERFPQGAGLWEYLWKIARQTPYPILCCYEADPMQCHRRILADYAEKMCGIIIPEWNGNQATLI